MHVLVQCNVHCKDTLHSALPSMESEQGVAGAVRFCQMKQTRYETVNKTDHFTRVSYITQYSSTVYIGIAAGGPAL